MEPAVTRPSRSRRKLLPIVVDTREQLPYQFDPARVSTVRRALPAGDYSLVGFETRAAIERKSLDDFVGTVIRARFRFEDELLSLAGYELGCVVVEASIADVLEHRYRAGVHPNAVLGAAFAIVVDHRVPVFFAGERFFAQRFVEGLLARFHKRVSSCQQPTK
jgi:DNA excision repair protein ERCC-4